MTEKIESLREGMKIFRANPGIVVINERMLQQPLEYWDSREMKQRRSDRLSPADWSVGVKRRKKKGGEKREVTIVNYRRRFLDSIGNVEYPEVCLERDQKAASGARKATRSLSFVETNDRDLADPFIELVARNWKVPLIFSYLKKNILPSTQLVASAV